MARSAKGRRRLSSHLRSTPYPLPSYRQGVLADGKSRRPPKAVKKDWEDATCSVCMEWPHNAVLLLCSSHDKGCRPYMCGTSYRYSNCLDQFKKAYMKAENQCMGSEMTNLSLSEKSEVTELVCPLCRGQVKGWTVVEPARKFLNAKKRSCMQDDCLFTGTYKELRKHVRAQHPSAKPRHVDPVVEQKWRRLEHERDREDVISTLRSSMPGALVLGDYVIESNDGFNLEEEGPFDEEDNLGRRGTTNENWFNFLFLLQGFGNRGNAGLQSRLRGSYRGYRVLDGEQGDDRTFHLVSESPYPSNSEAEYEEDDNEGGGGGVTIRRGSRSVAADGAGRPRRRRSSRSRNRPGLGS